VSKRGAGTAGEGNSTAYDNWDSQSTTERTIVEAAVWSESCGYGSTRMSNRSATLGTHRVPGELR
jgi:hypothetical protein